MDALPRSGSRPLPFDILKRATRRRPKKILNTDEDILNDLIFSGLPLLVSVCGLHFERDARRVPWRDLPHAAFGLRVPHQVMVGVGFGLMSFRGRMTPLQRRQRRQHKP